MAKSTDLVPGTRFVAQRGPHKGQEVEFIRPTAGNRAIIRPVGKNGVSWNGAKSEGAGVWTMGADAFARNYAQKGSAMTDDSPPRSGRAFRQKAKPPASRQVDMDNLTGASTWTSGTVLAPPPLNGKTIINDSHLTVEVIMITPDLARAWLERGGEELINRPIRRGWVELLTGAIRRGEWQLTGDSIKLDADGKIRDGQHRLTAIAEAGVPVQSLVVRNVNENAFDVMDSGRGRTAADVLALHGMPSRYATAAVTRAVILIERFGRPEPPEIVRDGSLSPSTPEQVAYAEEHRDEIREALGLSERLRHAHFVGGVGLWAAVFTLLIRKDAGAARSFAEELITGANLDRNSPALRLRNMYMADKDWAATKTNRQNLMALAFKAWNVWRRGGEIKYLSWRSDGPRPEFFPLPE